MIYTSYFGRMKAIQAADKMPAFCAVCGWVPDWYEGSRLKMLAPKWSWWKWWHDTYAGHYDSKEAVDYYTACYTNTVLKPLSRRDVLGELKCIAGGRNLYLLCFETPEKFCHRHLVADWLNEEADEKIVEWKGNDEDKT